MSREVPIFAVGESDAPAQGRRLRDLVRGLVDAATLVEITALLAHLSPEAVDARDNGGCTALHWACYFQTGVTGPAVVAALLAKMSPDAVGAREDHGYTALHVTCLYQTGATGPAVVAALVAKMSPEAIDTRNDRGWTALHGACDAQRGATGPAVIAALLAQMSPEAIDARDTMGRTALHMACIYQTGATGPALAAALLAKMSPETVDARANGGCTALRAACEKQTGATGPAVVSALLSQMSSDAVDARDDDGYTVLHLACAKQTGATGPDVVAALLVKMSPDTAEARDGFGNTALYFACIYQTGATGPAVIATLLGKMSLDAVDATLHSLSRWFDTEGDEDSEGNKYNIRATGVVRVLVAMREQVIGAGLRPSSFLRGSGDDPDPWRRLAQLGDVASVTPEHRAHWRAWRSTRRAPPALRLRSICKRTFADTNDAESLPPSIADAAADDEEIVSWRASCVAEWCRAWDYEVDRRLAPLRRSGLLRRRPFTAPPIRVALQARVADLDLG